MKGSLVSGNGSLSAGFYPKLVTLPVTTVWWQHSWPLSHMVEAFETGCVSVFFVNAGVWLLQSLCYS